MEWRSRADELLDEYQSINRSITGLQRQEQDLLTTIVSLRTEVSSSTPWKEPGRLALRKLLRGAKPGLVLHTREHGWAIWLGRAGGNGIGYVLTQKDRSIKIIEEYRRIDYVENQAHIEVPEHWHGIYEVRVMERTDEIDAMLAKLMSTTCGSRCDGRCTRQLLHEQADAEIADNTQLEGIRRRWILSGNGRTNILAITTVSNISAI